MSVEDRRASLTRDPALAGGHTATTGKVFFLARRGLRSLSHAGTPFLGHEAGDLFWRDVFEFVHEENLPALRGRISSMIEDPGSSSSIEVRFRDASGTWRWVEAGVQNMLEGPGDAGLLMVDLRDLSGSLGAEQNPRPAYRDFLAGLIPYKPPSMNRGTPRPTARNLENHR
ncbi:MAG: PAS domain-containing protein [Actinomycetota bacterium]|nr:PAS domain-containing protein [Actinomycetota bacterium]